MKEPFSVRGERVLVMGLGLHGGGLGAATWLARHGARVTVTDLKSRAALARPLKALKRLKRIRLVIGRHREKDFSDADIVIQNPAVPNDSPYLAHAREHGALILNEAALFFRFARAPVIGITGTKGKSSVTTFTGQLLRDRPGRVATVGNIRHSLFAVVDRFNRRDRIVAELSSWHLEGMAADKAAPHIAVLTNVHPDHLNRYPSFRAYQKAKEGIFAFQGPRDIAILNRDQKATRAIGARVSARRFWFSRAPFREEHGAFFRRGEMVFRIRGREERVIAAEELPFSGADDRMNALAAALAARLAGARLVSIRKRLRRLKKLPGRREVVRRLQGRTFINDTTATTPIATEEALKALHGAIVLIVGGENKQLSYAALARAIRRRGAYCYVLPGSASDLLARAFRALRYRNWKRTATLRTAVHAAWKRSAPGDTILLSPAAASFNQFRNEFHRGEVFEKAVNGLRA
jgi:UDP-N-acetylmuramoylalanine--D-glutamate ligase